MCNMRATVSHTGNVDAVLNADSVAVAAVEFDDEAVAVAEGVCDRGPPGQCDSAERRDSVAVRGRA